jgi:hypothetical protein
MAVIEVSACSHHLEALGTSVHDHLRLVPHRSAVVELGQPAFHAGREGHHSRRGGVPQGALHPQLDRASLKLAMLRRDAGSSALLAASTVGNRSAKKFPTRFSI